MVVNQSGKVLAHPDTAQLLKSMAHPEWLSRFSQEDGIFWTRPLASSWLTAS